jgi:hypothetical protein
MLFSPYRYLNEISGIEVVSRGAVKLREMLKAPRHPRELTFYRNLWAQGGTGGRAQTDRRGSEAINAVRGRAFDTSAIENGAKLAGALQELRSTINCVDQRNFSRSYLLAEQ